MSTTNPLLAEILEAINPEKPREVIVEFRGVSWTFRTAVPNKLAEWANTKFSASVLNTASVYSAPRLPEMVSATVAINGKDLRTIFSGELEKSLEPTIKSIKDRKDLQESERADLIENIVTLTALDMLYEWADSTFTGDMVTDLFKIYRDKVRVPEETRKADFFGSSTETPPTPSTPPTT